MKQYRALELFDIIDPTPQFGKVVTIDRTKVAKAKLFKENATVEKGLYRLFGLFEKLGGHAPY